jgi:hypothetical protein
LGEAYRTYCPLQEQISFLHASPQTVSVKDVLSRQ